MENYSGVLKKSVLFRGVEEKEIESLLRCLGAKVVKLSKGEYLLRVGDVIDRVAILLSGSLHIQNDDYWGNRSILRHVAVGEIIGEAYVLSGGEILLNDVVAVEDSEVMLLDAKRIVSTCPSACRFHTIVAQNMFFVIAEKNRQLVRKIGLIGKRSTREKLVAYLSDEAKRQNSSDIVIPFNRQQLADFLSVDRSAMSNELCKMRDEGLIAFNKNSFRLL